MPSAGWRAGALSSLYPKGIPIGRVTSVGQTDTDLFQQVQVDPYVDFTGRVTGYAVVDLRQLGDYDWRLSDRNVWKVERMLLDYPHRAITSSDERIDRLRRRYVAYRRRFGQKPVYYHRMDRWTELPTTQC